MNIDKNLQFDSHVKNICTKVNNQSKVIFRFRKKVPKDVKCKLYKAFIAPYFWYCSAVWHFCGAQNRNKLEHLNKRVLSIVLDEKSLNYQELLSKFKSSDLYSIRCQDMMKTVFKTIRSVWNDADWSTYVVFFKWGILNATYEDQSNLSSHTSIQPLMVFTPSDILLQTCGTN